MKTTQNWIRELCPADLDALQLENIFSRVGFEVARVERHEDDTVYDLEVTANHADWLGAIGIAREVAAVTGVPA